MDMNPSMSAGFIRSDIATVKKRLDGLKNFAWNCINWRTQTDLIMLRETNVSAPTVCVWVFHETDDSVGRNTTATSAHTDYSKVRKEFRQRKNVVATSSASNPTLVPLEH